MVSERIPYECMQSGLGTQQILTEALAITSRFSRRASRTLERDAEVVTADERVSRDGSNIQMELAIREYAQANHIWFDNVVDAMDARFGKDLRIGEGQESIVWADIYRGLVIKAKNTSMYETLEEFFEGMVLNNWLFEDCRQTIIGFGFDSQGMFRTLFETPYIEKTDFRPMTQIEKDEYLSLFGFMPKTKHSYTNGVYEILDTHNQNMVIASDGTIAVIDAIIKWAHGEHYLPRTAAEIEIDDKNEDFMDELFG